MPSLKIETITRLVDTETGEVIYQNAYRHEEDDPVDPDRLVGDYAVTGPNRTKRHMAVGLERWKAYVAEKAMEDAKKAARPAAKPKSKKKTTKKGGNDQ